MLSDGQCRLALDPSQMPKTIKSQINHSFYIFMGAILNDTDTPSTLSCKDLRIKFVVFYPDV
jgi:hypothetical protein